MTVSTSSSSAYPLISSSVLKCVVTDPKSSDLCSEATDSERLSFIPCRSSSLADSSVTGGNTRDIPAEENLRNAGVDDVDGDIVWSSSGRDSILAGLVSSCCVISWSNSSVGAEDLRENMNHVNPAKRDDEMKNNDVNKAKAMIRWEYINHLQSV